MMGRIRMAAQPKVVRLRILCFRGHVLVARFVVPQVVSSSTGSIGPFSRIVP